MKKSLVFMIAVLLVGALMISCNGDVSNNSDNLATVSLKTDTSKGLSTTPSSNITEVDQLYWYYTATKTDGSMFTTGATSEKTPVVSAGTTGLVNQYIGGENSKTMFSTGRWSFSFYGYKDYNSNNSPAYSDLVYKCEDLAVTITGDTELTLTLETVSSSPAQLSLGSPAPYWQYDNALTDTSLTLKIYDGSNLLATSTATVSDHKATFTHLFVGEQNVSSVQLATGIHSLDFEVWYGNEKVGSAALNLNAKANYSYPVTGDIANLNVTYSVKVKSTTTAVLETNSIDTNNKMSVSITPQAASSGASSALTTSVDFSNASNVTSAANTTYSLAVDVLAGTGASTIGVSAYSANVNVANIDLTLTKTTTTNSGTTVENVTSFGTNGYVTVETYIGVGLTNVKVNGVAVNGAAENGVSDVAYDSATGKLTFRTTHFSEFAVTSDAVASIGTGDNTKYYSSFLGALSAAKTTDTVTLLANVDIGYDNYKSNPYNTITTRQKSFVCAYNPVFIRCSLDLNQQTLSTPNFSLVVASDNVTVSNGAITAYKANKESNTLSYDKNTHGSYALAVMADNVTINNVNTTGGLSIGGSLDGGDETPGAKGAFNTIISGCNITAPGTYYAIVSQTGSRGQAYSNCTLNKPNSSYNIVTVWGSVGDMGKAGDVNELSFDNVTCLQNPFSTPSAGSTSNGFTRSATDSNGGYTISGSGDYASGSLTVTKANDQYTLNGTLRYIIH